KNLEQAPYADAVAVFAPGEIRIVVDIARQIAANNARAARIVFLVRLLDRIPIFEIRSQNDSEPFPARPFERPALHDRNEVVLHDDCLRAGSCSSPLQTSSLTRITPAMHS